MESMDRLNAVFSKWENRGPPQGGSTANSQDYNRTIEQGRQAWRSKFKESNLPAPSFRRPQQRRSRHDNYNPPVDMNHYLANLAFFKVAPTVIPQSSRFSRPFMGRCCSCMPQSRMDFHDEDTETQGMKNVLAVVTRRSEMPWLTRTFYHASFVMRRTVSHKYPDVSLAVLTSPRVVEAIQKSAMEEQGVEDMSELSVVQLERQEKMAKKLLRRLQARISNALIRLTGWFLHKLLSHLYSAVLIHEGQMAMVKEATQRRQPIIFLPTHRSHMDYILLTFVLFNFDIHAPHVAAGDNLIIPLFGALMRGLGGYFIRRRLDHRDGRKDLLYRAILHTYMEQLLCRNEYFEFFLEGGRSRSGKSLPPRGGLLSIIVDSYMEGLIPDAYIVPVSFSYDKVLEGNFNKEQMGEAKHGETFWGAWKAILKVIFSKYGSVRVDFAQPFSLKEYLEVSQSFTLDTEIRSEFSPSVTPPKNKVQLSGSTSSLFGMEDHRATIEGLAEHVVHTFCNIQAIMSSHIVAYLLLTHHRRGTNLAEMQQSAEWLRGEIQSRRRDLGFCGKTEDVLSHGMDLLGDHLVQTVVPSKSKTDTSEDDVNNNKAGDVFIRPNISLPNVFELSYYANPVISIFALEGIMAVSVCLEADDCLWTKAGTEAPSGVSKNALLQQALNLCHIFQYEFVFKSPCKSWETTLNDIVEHFIMIDILNQEQEGSGPDAAWAKRYSKSVMWAGEDSSEEEDEYVSQDKEYSVNMEAYSLERLRILTNGVGPLVEAYHIVVCNLSQLKDKSKPETEFVKQMHAILRERAVSGIAAYVESAAMDTVQNCVRSLVQMKLLEVTIEGSTRCLQLSTSDGAAERLEQVLETLDACKLCNMV